MNETWIEIKRFFMDYRKFILIGSIIISIIFAGFNYLAENVLVPDEEEMEIDREENPSSAYFQFYIETENATIFANGAIVNQFFNLRETYNNINQEIGIDLIELISEGEQDVVISVTRDGNSGLFTTEINVGNESDNYEIANFYYNQIFNDEIHFLEDKSIYSFVEPRLRETDEDDIIIGENTQSVLPSMVQNLVVGFIVGGVAFLGLALLKELFGKKLSYSFAYESDRSNSFTLIDADLKNLSLLKMLTRRNEIEPKLCVIEDDGDAVSHDYLDQNSSITNDLLNSLNSDSPINELDVVLIVIPGKTTRKWFKRQLKIMELKELQYKIVQINSI